MKYCPNTTVTHPLSLKYQQHVDTINNIIASKAKEPHPQPFTNEVALKLDKAKDSSVDPNVKRMKSMDMVLGMKDNDNKLSLLVDFKLDCKNPINISESECRDKIKHSKILLFGSGVSIHNVYVFVFNDMILQQAKRVISQKLANASGEVLGITELKSKYF